MMDLPNPREMVGPSQIQQIQRDIEWIKDMVRSQTIRPSPTVRPTITSTGTVLEAAPQAPSAQEESTSVWL